MQQTLAALADIHGNSWALEAVLHDLRRREIQRIVNLGDSFYGPLDPAGTLRLLTDPLLADRPTVLGNQDRILSPEHRPNLDNPTLDYVAAQLGEEAVEKIAAAPESLVLEDKILLVHASPRSMTEYLLEEIWTGGPVLKSKGMILEAVRDVEQEIILCGHSHIPRLVKAGSKIIINPGSVGLQAYFDDSPIPHAMECGSPHARYAILEFTLDRVDVEFVCLEYDWESASKKAREMERFDWSAPLVSGRAESG